MMYLYAANIVLEDPTSPTVNDVTGELASGSTLKGTSDLAFDAGDVGSGVYEAVVSVDGTVAQRTVLDGNGGKCAAAGGEGGVSAFLSPQPCAANVSATLGFDTTELANGSHHLVVTVSDAAGNGTVAVDRQVTVANPAAAPPGPLNGTNASADASLRVAWVGASTARLVSGYGHAETIAGRLTAPGGAGIADARVECSYTASYSGARGAALACPRTDAQGRFTVRVAPGASSRTLRFLYREHLGDARAAASASLTLSVRAGVRLAVRPRTSGVGRRIRFTGRLLGGPLPRGGKQVVLEARSSGGRWIEFDVVRAEGGGRFRSSYRFRFAGPARYQFRAVSESEADYPYAGGASNVVGVRER
ncbi:MAG TPA: hypothetical protein VMG62_01200 [Solirubrobacteraceae bacterium]|nr:hypothetical protein [Solirubrobacteraceae bacterium]